jgi:hypothetical protein
LLCGGGWRRNSGEGRGGGRRKAAESRVEKVLEGGSSGCGPRGATTEMLLKRTNGSQSVEFVARNQIFKTLLINSSCLWMLNINKFLG